MELYRREPEFLFDRLENALWTGYYRGIGLKHLNDFEACRGFSAISKRVGFFQPVIDHVIINAISARGLVSTSTIVLPTFQDNRLLRLKWAEDLLLTEALVAKVRPVPCRSIIGLSAAECIL